MQVTAEFGIEAWDQLSDLFLGDGRGQIDVPDGQAGEIVVAWEQAMQEGRSAAEISQDEERFLDRLSFVTGKQDVI